VTARDEITVRDRLQRALALTGGDGVPSLPGLSIISLPSRPTISPISAQPMSGNHHVVAFCDVLLLTILPFP
jgi:hypothetical protein